MITVIGFTLGIPDTVMGLTFIAAGVSVPDALSGIAVVREGQRDKLRGVFTIHSSVRPKPSFGVRNRNQGPSSVSFFVETFLFFKRKSNYFFMLVSCLFAFFSFEMWFR